MLVDARDKLGENESLTGFLPNPETVLDVFWYVEQSGDMHEEASSNCDQIIPVLEDDEDRVDTLSAPSGTSKKTRTPRLTQSWSSWTNRCHRMPTSVTWKKGMRHQCEQRSEAPVLSRVVMRRPPIMMSTVAATDRSSPCPPGPKGIWAAFLDLSLPDRLRQRHDTGLLVPTPPVEQIADQYRHDSILHLSECFGDRCRLRASARRRSTNIGRTIATSWSRRKVRSATATLALDGDGFHRGRTQSVPAVLQALSVFDRAARRSDTLLSKGRRVFIQCTRCLR